MSTLGSKLSEGVLVDALVVRDDLSPEKRMVEIRSVILKVAEAEGKLDVVAGELLCEIRDSGYWEQWGFTSFIEYLDKEVPFKKRKAFYLMAIFDKFVKELGIPASILRKLEWSKVKELVSVITKENWEKLLEKIKGKSVAEVVEMVREMKGKTKPKTIAGEATETMEIREDGTAIRVHFTLAKEQYDNVMLALKVAGKEAGSEKSGHLIDVICTDYIAGRTDKEGLEAVAIRLQRQIENIQRVYGVELEIKGVK